MLIVVVLKLPTSVLYKVWAHYLEKVENKCAHWLWSIKRISLTTCFHIFCIAVTGNECKKLCILIIQQRFANNIIEASLFVTTFITVKSKLNVALNKFWSRLNDIECFHSIIYGPQRTWWHKICSTCIYRNVKIYVFASQTL